MKTRELALQQARGGELRALSEAVFGSVLQLAIQLGENLTWVRQWSRDERPVPDHVMGWLRRLASHETDRLVEPLPPGWVRHIEVLPNGRTRSLPTNTRLEDRRKAMEAREAEKAAKVAERVREQAERRQVAFRLRQEGLSLPEIAREIGGTHQAARKLVMQEQKDRADAEKRKHAFSLRYDQGLGLVEIAAQLGDTRQNVARMVNQEKVERDQSHA